MMTAKTPNPMDKHVGNRMRMRRILLGMSQEALGAALGVTFQQVQKYEKGTNRVSASRLQQLAEVLKTPVNFFFEDAPGMATANGFAEESPAFVSEFMATPDGIALMRAFMQIRNPQIRRSIIELAERIAAQEAPPR